MKKGIIFAVFCCLIVTIVDAKENKSCFVENSKVSYLYYLNIAAYDSLTNSSFYYPINGKDDLSFLNLNDFKNSKNFKLLRLYENSGIDIHSLMSNSYNYSIEGDTFKYDGFITTVFDDSLFAALLPEMKELSKHIDWTAYDKVYDELWVRQVSDNYLIRTSQNWLNKKFNRNYNFHLRISNYDGVIPEFRLSNDTVYLCSGLMSNVDKNNVGLYFFGAFTHLYLSSCNNDKLNDDSFIMLLHAMQLQYCKEVVPSLYNSEVKRIEETYNNSIYKNHTLKEVTDKYNSIFPSNAIVSPMRLSKFLKELSK